MRLNVANNFETFLTSGITDSDTVITVDDATGAPDAPFRLRIAELELIQVDSVTGNQFTTTRGVEGTTAQAHSIGSKVELTWTAGVKESMDAELDEHIGETALADGVHGLAGKVIEESGSNDDGSYVKFADGTLVCYKFRFLNQIFSAGTHIIPWSYPASFFLPGGLFVNYNPVFQASADVSRLTSAFFVDGGSPSPFQGNGCELTLTFSSGTSASVRFGMFAVGRWK